jgi:hypothetical protein
MRAWEFLTEDDLGAQPKQFPDGQLDAMPGPISMPDISMNKANGSAYAQWRFSVAMAGAPDYPTPPVGPMAGDPLLCTYTDVELQIVNAAAKMVGAGRITKLASNRSTELSNTQKVSPLKGFKGYKRK